ncbi:hypothetical protein QYE76_009474 [Lolium multiflorum]|uniref:Retrotransposon gag domain-containing protein n=1 Tax=Lolium multiflorum TaxID=4521 RepID=A0AAD8X3D9_LOLMU|nr:hypothetical protein QYE76_009474 [Lolium multiflorum]
MMPKRKAIGYTKPYPNEYELIPLPPKYRLPDFTKFSGSDGSSSIEHVSRYLAQGMISASDELRVRYFSQSLTGSAFGWYTSLPPNSIQTGSSWKNGSTSNITQRLPRRHCRSSPKLIALKRKYAGYIAPSGPILEVLIYGPSLPSSSPSSLPSALPGLVIAPMAADWALIAFIFSASSSSLSKSLKLPGQGQNRWPAARRRSSHRRLPPPRSPPPGRGEVAGEVVIVALLHRFPNGEETEVTLPVGRGFVILGPYEGVMILFVPLRWGEDIETKRGIIHTFLSQVARPCDPASVRDQEALRAVARGEGQPQP